MSGRRSTGSDFRCEVTIRPGEDPEEAETRWYRWDEEEKRWEFYGNKRPSWDELSEGAKQTLTRAYDIMFRSLYDKERREAIRGGMDPEELPENPKTFLDVLYYLNEIREQKAGE